MCRAQACGVQQLDYSLGMVTFRGGGERCGRVACRSGPGASVSKQLECHGFICDSPEEAIMLAANLYQALLETMKRNKRSNSAAQVNTISRNTSCRQHIVNCFKVLKPRHLIDEVFDFR